MSKHSLKKIPEDKEIIVEVTEQEYQDALARGLKPDETLPPGRHRFQRGGFLNRMGISREELAAASIKVRISILLDADVLEYFKQRASASGATPYQTQINSELRAVMERERIAPDAREQFKQELLSDEQFLGALVSRLAKKERRRAPKAG